MAKKNKKVSIQARRRLFFVRPICLALIIVFLATLASKMVDLYQLNNTKKEKEEEYEQLQEESEYLKNEIVKLHDPEYLAKFARENYSYSKDGEIIIQVKKEKEQEKKVEEKVKEENVEIIFWCGLGIFVIFLYMILRSFFSRKKQE